MYIQSSQPSALSIFLSQTFFSGSSHLLYPSIDNHSLIHTHTHTRTHTTLTHLPSHPQSYTQTYNIQNTSSLLQTATHKMSKLGRTMRAIAIKALQCGSIPQHVGFIMDGNRRYGRKVNVGNDKGYYLGYDTMEEVSWAYASTQTVSLSLFLFPFSLFRCSVPFYPSSSLSTCLIEMNTSKMQWRETPEGGSWMTARRTDRQTDR